MDQDKAKEIKENVEKALQGLGDNWRVDVQSGHFGTHSVKLNVEVIEVFPDGNAGTQEAEAFTENAIANGLSPNIIFKEFETAAFGVSETAFKIVGFNERSTKMPIVLEGMKTKRRFKISVAELKKVLPK
jgi:hypothetical protein